MDESGGVVALKNQYIEAPFIKFYCNLTGVFH